MLIATDAIFRIGAEILFLKSLFLIKRLTTNHSNFMKTKLSKHFKITVLFCLILLTACKAQQKNEIIVGANLMSEYLPLLKDKNVAIVGNQTSLVKTSNKEYVHLVDTLLKRKVSVKKVFAPEHGFRGQADAGEKVENGIDKKTGLPIISLYGKNKKPSVEQLEHVDIMIFDIQDVGVRFYTYISTLHYIMEACAENKIPLIVLDRPNPNGDYIDGPILESEYKSFVGMHPVPVVHGLTIAEYAQMINDESWLSDNLKTDLRLIYMKNYNKDKKYEPPVPPSPNLPNYKAIRLYPSLCFFEGTNVSVGRGTDFPFQVFGAPFLPLQEYSFKFTPQPNAGAKYPKHKGKVCHGKKLDLSLHEKINLSHLIKAYKNAPQHTEFFNDFFNKLAGNEKLQHKIKQNKSAEDIYKSWSDGLEKFKDVQNRYTHYSKD